MTTAGQKSSLFFKRNQFWLILISAIILRFIPIISIPFNWLESYFHELSHGLSAILTGGVIVNIQLFPNGAGLCTTQGGWRFAISFMGYAGAALWGAVIYIAAASHQRVAQVLSVILVVVLSLSILLWVRDLFTVIILLALIVMFVFIIKANNAHYLSLFMQLSGLSIVLNALFSPFYLVDGRHLGDGATLANLTFIPEVIWIVIWAVISMYTLYSLGKYHLRKRLINRN